MTRHKWLYALLVAFLFSIGSCSHQGPAKRDKPLVPPEKVELKGGGKSAKLPDNPDE